MQELRDVVRSKVDALRAAGGAERYDREQLLAALARIPATSPREPADTQVVHLCPWHTCQATRHG